MLDAFLQFFPACALFVTLAFIVADEWRKEDRSLRRSLIGCAVRSGNVIRVFEQEPERDDCTLLCEYDIRTYFDELPQQRRF
jgi:hypothetical protein